MVLLFQEPFKKHLTKNLAKLLCYSFQFLMFLMRMNEVINPNSLTIYCQRYCCCLESLNLKFIDPSAPSQTTKSNKKCCEDGVTFKEKLECNPAGKIQWLCCTFSGGVVLIVWFTTNGVCVKNNTIIYVARASNKKRDCDVETLPILTCEQSNMMASIREERLRAWSLSLLAATVRSFAHMPLGISDRNSYFWSLDKFDKFEELLFCCSFDSFKLQIL